MIPEFQWVQGATFAGEMEFDDPIDGVALSMAVAATLDDGTEVRFTVPFVEVDVVNRRANFAEDSSLWPPAVYRWAVRSEGVGIPGPASAGRGLRPGGRCAA